MKKFIIEADVDDGDIYFTVKGEGEDKPFACIGKTSRRNGGGYCKPNGLGFVWVNADECLLSEDEEDYLGENNLTLHNYRTDWTDAACYILCEYLEDFHKAAMDVIKEKRGLEKVEKDFCMDFEYGETRTCYKANNWRGAHNAIRMDAAGVYRDINA